MLSRLREAVALAAALTLGTAALADEAEIMARYDAYNAAFAAGRFEEAAAQGEAAWRAAEAEWGAREETAVLAFNLATVQLLLDRRAEAIEPALRALALVEEGVAGASIPREEAAALAAYAQLDAEDPSRDQIEALASALVAFTPTQLTSRRLAGRAWFYLAQAEIQRRRWRQAADAADRATLMLEGEPRTEPALIGAIATLGAKAATELRDYERGLAIVHRGIAAFPPQPVDMPIDRVLGALLGWDAGLHNIVDQEEEGAARGASHVGHRWQEGRYPTAMGCAIEWLERPAPKYPRRAAGRGHVIGMHFEYYLDADGSVIRVDFIGSSDDSLGFTEAALAALRGWKAAPQPRAECRGPWPSIFAFQPR